MWVIIILLEYLVDGIGIFVNVFVVVFPGMFLRGRNGFRDGERLGTCLRNGFLGVPKFMNSGFRIVGSVSRCSEMMIKIGYGKWTTPTQATYIRSELYLFNKLGELTGTSPCSLNGCGPAVLFPRGSCVCTVCKMFTEEFPEFAFLILCDFVWKATFLLQLLLNFAINMCLKPNGLTYDFRAHAL